MKETKTIVKISGTCISDYFRNFAILRSEYFIPKGSQALRSYLMEQ